MDIIQRIAQLESEQIEERVYVGMEQKAKTNGGVLGFNIPYGYDYSNGKLTIKHNESENVKNIFQNYLNGISMKKIAQELNLKNIPTKLNKTWGIQTISLILKNPVYCGYLHWEDYLNPSDHPPIVDKNSFNEVQKLIQKKNIKTGHQSNSFIIE